MTQIIGQEQVVIGASQDPVEGETHPLEGKVSAGGQQGAQAGVLRPLAVLIPSCTGAFLATCLTSLEKSSPGSLASVIVGDNGLEPDVRIDFPQVTYVDIPKPFVFARAINLMAAAAPPDADLFVLNDDTEMQTPEWQARVCYLMDLARELKFGLLACGIVGGVGNDEQRAERLPVGGITECTRTVCFIAVGIPREIWNRVGPLDERFVGYGFDDDDYNRRVKAAGFKCGATSAVIVAHGRAGFPHSSSYMRLLGSQEWDRQYKLNGQIFQAKYGQQSLRNRFCLNIGCGDQPRSSEGMDRWLNLNLTPGPGVDVVRDIRRGLPFNDETFDHVLLDNVLEHFVSEDVIFIINEIDRVLKVGGLAEIIVPHAHALGAIHDPTHKSLFVARSALYWNQIQSKYGGRFVGITANLVARNEQDIATFGDPESELFIRFLLTKIPYTPQVGGTDRS